MEIGELLKNARLRSNTTQSALAQSLGVSRATVSSWEKGQRMPSVEQFREMAELLDLSKNDIDKNLCMSYRHKLSGFNLASLNAHGLSKLYEFYYKLVDDESNLK